MGELNKMKKTIMLITLLLVTVGCTKQTTDSTKKSSEHSATKNSSIVSSTIVSTDKVSEVPEASEQSSKESEPSEITATTPQNLRGSWIGNNGEQDLEVTITENTIITNGQTYKVTSYTESNNTFTILWDIDSVTVPGNPQPFIYTYVPETDQMTNGITFHRK